MKSRIASLMLFISFLFTASAFAQNQTMVVHIPFTFHAGDKILPAANYEVLNRSDRTLVLRAVEGKKSLVLLGQSIETTSPDLGAKLVFRNYGETYFLSQVWQGHKGSGLAFPVSHDETIVAKGRAKATILMAKER